MKSVIVGGALANKLHNGGEAWVRLSWILGFRKLGYRVCFVEQIARNTCVDAAGSVAPFDECANLEYFRRVTEQFGLAGDAALIYQGGEQIYGMAMPELLDMAESADLLVNISGHLSIEPLMRRIRRKVYVDIDPGFTQFWHIEEGSSARVGGHDYYYTIGENIGSPDCVIPTAGIPWRRIRQPVVLDHWPVCGDGMPDRFTTIANWRGPFGSIHFDGRTFGLKVHEFRKFIELPTRAPQRFELALNIHPAEHKDLDALNRNGWRVVDPRSASADPEAFRRYIQGSGAEFSVAQGIYVDTRSGWFSDRTARYLASGKPALVQDTGFSRNLPVGEGLVPFRTLDDAVRGAERIASDYPGHCAAARAIAEECFDSTIVLSRLLDEVGVTL